MGFIQRHKILLSILSFLFIGIPRYVESIWSLVERLQEVEMTTQFSFDWLYWITMPIGLGMLIFIILQSRKVSKTVDKDKVLEMLQQGQTDKQVGDYFHVTRQTIGRNWRKKFEEQGLLSARPIGRPVKRAVIVQPTQVAVAQQYSSQVRETLNALIKSGEELCERMRRKDFDVGYVESLVREWLDAVSRDVWDIVPKHGSYITGDQGKITMDEKLRYEGWKYPAASLRISVDRRISRLREVLSGIPDMLKSPRPPELQISYQKHEFGVFNGEPIITVWAEYRPTTGTMRIEAIRLQLVGEPVPSLDWKACEVKQDVWISSDNKFKVPDGISPGEHDVTLAAFANGEWWGSQPFPIAFP